MSFIRIDRAVESSHFLLTGDSGAGKSQVIHQWLPQIRARGDAAVVLCSKPDFIPAYYTPEFGDQILSPKDDRIPHMDLGREITDEADALAVLRAFYPSHPEHPQARFFDDHAWRISAYVFLKYRPDYREFGCWLQNPEQCIYPKLRGTEHEITLNKNAAPQKAGVDATLNEVGTAMRMMPGRDEGRPELTLREWATGDRRGWLFLPNPANLREALRPLLSGWMDMLIRFVMSSREQRRRVWFVLDELDTLNGLPAVIDGITQMRESGNPMVLGMQSIAQLKKRYGPDQAETIFSQPFTKVILATSAPGSKEELSKLIGEALFRRYRVSTGKGGGSSSGPEEFMRPLVMPSEIGTLKNLNGYLVQRGEIVKIRIPYQQPPQRHPAMIERKLPDAPLLPLSVAQPVMAMAEVPDIG